MSFRRRALGCILASAVVISACSADEPDNGAERDNTDGADSTTPPADDGPREAELEEQQRQAAEDAYDQREAALAGPSQTHRDQAAELVEDYSLEQLAGTVIIGEYSGTDGSAAASLIAQHHLAGVIVMGQNVPDGPEGMDPQALAEEISTIRAAGENRDVAPMVSIDQEGGLVTRVGAPVTEWPTPMAYGAVYQNHGDTVLARRGHRMMGEDLLDLGFSISFAPNADVTFGAADPTIGSRSFGSDPEAVAELALDSIRGISEGGLIGSLKHFPGHGSLSDDSHYTLPVQEQSVEELRQRDWVPFAQGVAAGVPMVMMGHMEVPDLEAEVPSSLSQAAYQEIRDMGHEGVIVTDAMNMAAIANTYGGDQAAVMALSAGADLLLMPSNIPGAHAAIINAVQGGDLEESRLTEAAERVLALGLWQQDLADGELAAGPTVPVADDVVEYYPELAVSGPREQATEYCEDFFETFAAAEFSAFFEPAECADYDSSLVASLVSAAAVTMVEGRCDDDDAPVLTGEFLQIQGGTDQDRARLTQVAQEAGFTVGSGPLVTLLGGSQPASGDVVVALDRPEALAGSAAETKIALYGRSTESFEALLAVLSGAQAPGGLPVDVGEASVGHRAC